MTWALVLVYLVSIIVANGLVSYFGPPAMPGIVFVLIPLDLTLRDALHERWEGKWLWVAMGCLIGAGSLISYLTSSASPDVCWASSISFLAAGIVDTSVYSGLKRRPKWLRINASNLASSIIDSVVFPWIAFGLLSLTLSTIQTLAKFVGGVFWSFLFIYITRRRVIDAANHKTT